jgi:hypothetical protein
MLGSRGVSSIGSSTSGSNGDGISIPNRIGIATRIAIWYTIIIDNQSLQILIRQSIINFGNYQMG